MTRKILVAAIALFVCSAASANCMREIFGAIICGQLAQMAKMEGYIALPNVTAQRSWTGGIVCGAGRCVQDVISGQIMCSREPGAMPIRTLDGVSCLGVVSPQL